MPSHPETVSLQGLDPAEALRALLAIKPDEAAGEPPAVDEGDDGAFVPAVDNPVDETRGVSPTHRRDR